MERMSWSGISAGADSSTGSSYQRFCYSHPQPSVFICVSSVVLAFKRLLTERNMPTRRQFLQAISGLAWLGLARSTSSAQEKPVASRRLFCLQTYSYSIRQREERGFGDPLALMQFASRQGFAGVQLRLGER